MITKIQPIQTKYNGYLFRSRLEARWAVFFDALGIPYEYEKEGYDLGENYYLPDFWLPDQNCWVEIKGKEPTAHEYELMEFLCVGTQRNVFVFWGPIEKQCEDTGVDQSAQGFFHDYDGGFSPTSERMWWGELRRKAGDLRPQFGIANWTKEHWQSDKIHSAYQKAQQARFEHGQTPDPSSLRQKATTCRTS